VAEVREESALLGKVAAATVVAVALLMAIQPVRSADVWHHVKSGWLVLEQGGPARSEVFSHTAAGRPWIQYEWLAQVVWYLAYAGAGTAGLILLRALAMAVAALLLLWACRAREDSGWADACLAVALAMCAVSTRAYSRPEMFTWVLFAALILAVESLRRGRRAMVFVVPALFVPWVNLHGAWVAGLAWMGLTLAGEAIRAMVPSHRPAARSNLLSPRAVARPSPAGDHHPMPCSPPLGRRNIPWLALALGLAVLATLANPYGAHIWKVPFKLMRTPEVRQVIAEWQSPAFRHWLDSRFLGVWVLAAAFVGANALAWRRTRIADVLVVALFGVLALTARRHIPLLLVVTAPVLAGQMSMIREYARSHLPRLSQAGGPTRCLVLAILASGGLVILALGGFTLDRAGMGLDRRKYPIGAARFLRRERLEGNLFNSYAYGNYLLFALYPENRVFIDGRVDMYGREVVALYDRVRTAAPGWEKVLRRHEVQACVLETNRTTDRPLLEALHSSPDWQLVFWDDNSAVYLLHTPDREEMLRRLPAYSVRPYGFDEELASTPEGLRLAERDYRRKLEEDPDCIPAVLGLAECLSRRGALPEAVALLRRAIADSPGVSALTGSLGARLYEMDALQEAEVWFRLTLRLGGYDALAYRSLGAISQRRGDLKRAVRYYRKALRLDPRNWKVYWNLSTAYEALGDRRRAAEALQAVLRIRPRMTQAAERLRALNDQPQR